MRRKEKHKIFNEKEKFCDVYLTEISAHAKTNSAK